MPNASHRETPLDDCEIALILAHQGKAPLEPHLATHQAMTTPCEASHVERLIIERPQIPLPAHHPVAPEATPQGSVTRTDALWAVVVDPVMRVCLIACVVVLACMEIWGIPKALTR